MNDGNRTRTHGTIPRASSRHLGSVAIGFRAHFSHQWSVTMRSLPVAFMQRDGQHPPVDGQTPYQVPRPCDHCATVLPESELVPHPKSSLYLVHAPELLCGPCWERTRSRIRRSKYRAVSERCLMDHHLERTISYDIANCIACGAPLLRGADMFECTTCTDMWTYCVD